MSNRWSPSVKLLIVVILLLGTVWLLAQVHVIMAPIIIALLLADTLDCLSAGSCIAPAGGAAPLSS